MIYKSIDNKEKLFYQLELFAKIAPYKSVQKIRYDLANMKKGYYHEKQCAYILDFEMQDLKYSFVLHDLRLKLNNQTAQIDHLVITPAGFFIFESKYFGQKVQIDSKGQWYIHAKRGKMGINSPMEQNKRHIHLLKQLLLSKDLIPSRLGIRINLLFKDYILVSTQSIIEGDVPPNVIQYDLARTKMLETYDNECNKYFRLNTFKLVANLMTLKETAKIAKKLVSCHEPVNFDYATKYNLPQIDTKLLNILYEKRSQIVLENLQFPDEILNDIALENIARYKPQNPQQFMKITGITKIQFASYGYKILNYVLKYKSYMTTTKT